MQARKLIASALQIDSKDDSHYFMNDKLPKSYLSQREEANRLFSCLWPESRFAYIKFIYMSV